RDEQAAREAEQARIAKLLKAAERLQARIAKSDERFDAAAAELGQAHAENHALRVEQASLLDQAGALAPGHHHQWGWTHLYSGALAFALLNADPDKDSGRASTLVGAYGSFAAPKPLASVSGESNKGA